MITRHSWTRGLLVALFGLLLYAHPALAQNADDFDDMSLEDLLNTEVVTASKNAEGLSDAPGIVSTITAKEIEQFGATSLLEVLERAPGFYAIGTSGFPQGMLSIRGDAATTINNHVLVLLDGRPMRESLHGGLNTPIYTGFPLESIDRLEIVRGPGSVLYGSNAYAGVINIITKKADAGTELSTKVGYGSFNAKRVAAHGGYATGDLSVTAGVQYHKDEGQGESVTYVPGDAPGSFVPVPQNVGETFNLGEDVLGATVSAQYGGLSFTSFAGLADQSYYPSGFSAEPADFRHVTADLGYEHALTEAWDASVNVTFNYDRQLHNGADEMNRDFIVEATNYVRPFANANLVVGGLVYALHGASEIELADFMDPTAPPTHIESVTPYDELWWSAYTQLDVRPIEKLKLIAGGQVNKVEGLGLDFVPRLGAVYNATETVGTKLLYGQAFRSPYAVERSLNVPGFLQGNPDLKPEKVTSLDAQLFYNASKMQLAATYFNASQQDLIVKVSLPLEPGQFWAPQTYVNKGELTIQGIELEAKGKPTDRVFFTGSFVYQQSEDDEGVSGTTFVPEVMGKVGVTYESRLGVTLGLFDNYFNAPTSQYDLDPEAWVNPATGEFDPDAPGMNPPADAFNYLTGKLSVNVTKLMRLRNFPKMALDFYATNLLGNEIYVSDIDLTNLSVPRQDGRAFYAGFRVEL